jgi:hypothetical protein
MGFVFRPRSLFADSYGGRGEFLWRIEAALSDYRDESHSLFQEIIRNFQARVAGRGGDLAYSLRFARVTLHNKHSVPSLPFLMLPSGEIHGQSRA